MNTDMLTICNNLISNISNMRLGEILLFRNYIQLNKQEDNKISPVDMCNLLLDSIRSSLANNNNPKLIRYYSLTNTLRQDLNDSRFNVGSLYDTYLYDLWEESR